MIDRAYIYFVDIDLGPCCACGATGPAVRNIIQLPFLAPTLGAGWGCVKCELPTNGAIAVVCDSCRVNHAPLKYALDGLAADKGRIAIEQLTQRFDHKRFVHADEIPAERARKKFKNQNHRR